MNEKIQEHHASVIICDDVISYDNSEKAGVGVYRALRADLSALLDDQERQK